MGRSSLSALLALSLILLFHGFFFIAAEVGLRLWSEPPSAGPALNLVERDEPYAYRLNPDHPEISSQGLRDREFEIPKPAGVFRILMLGDSVTYGLFVKREQAFPKVLEALLRQRGLRVEVINAGMNGYTIWNELQWFKRHGAAFQADLVVLGFCPNDVVDPVLHWGDDEGYFRNLPAEAIPDLDRHRRDVEPFVYGPKALLRRLLKHSAVYRFVSGRWKLLEERPRRYLRRDGKSWPVYLADDDTGVSLQALENPESTEWRWLAARMGELKESVEASGARFAAVYLPLAYQLQEGYPLHPEQKFLDFCRSRGIFCMDFLPEFKNRGAGLYLGSHRYHPRDVWHFSARGHLELAKMLEQYLEKEHLLAAAAPASPSMTHSAPLNS